MKLKGWFILHVLLLAAILILLAFHTHLPQSWLFYVIEGLCFVTILLLFYFYHRVIRPIRTIADGMELLREQDFSSRLRKVGQKEADRIVEIFNRMMGQLKEERLRLREQNNFLDLLIKAAPMGVIILDFDGNVTSINPAAIAFLSGSTDMIDSQRNEDKKIFLHKKLSAIDLPLAENLNCLKPNETKTVQLSDAHIFRCSRLSFVDRGFSHPFLLIESLTDEVMKVEKKAYEKVIRMIAHEVNNTTAGVTSSLETVTDVLKNMPEAADLSEVMQVCIERCCSMSSFITKFADVVKIPDPQWQDIDLNDRISSCLRFMENFCVEHHIRLHLNLCQSEPHLQLDSSLFEQVFVNIVKNSVESIGQDGDIYITSSDSPITLEIADTGKGISKEVETKLFSPFFSTKPNGQGLGLIFIREVLTKFGCRFSLKTYSDGLTRFRILFK